MPLSPLAWNSIDDPFLVPMKININNRSMWKESSHSNCCCCCCCWCRSCCGCYRCCYFCCCCWHCGYCSKKGVWEKKWIDSFIHIPAIPKDFLLLLWEHHWTWEICRKRANVCGPVYMSILISILCARVSERVSEQFCCGYECISSAFQMYCTWLRF